MTTPEIHPAAQLFPMMTERELLELTRSVATSGLQHPILRFEGKVIDGRNRLEACARAGVTPGFRDIFIEGNPFEWVWATNAERRMLSPDQRAAIRVLVAKRSGEWARRQAELKAEADRRRAEESKGNRNAAKEQKRSRPESGATVSQPPAKRRQSGSKVAEQVASEIGVSRGKVEAAHRLAVEAPEKAEQVARGEKKLCEATAEAFPRPKEPPAPKRRKSDFVTDPGSFAGIGGPPLTRTPPPPAPPPPPVRDDLDDDEPGICEDDFDLDEEQHAGLRALNPKPAPADECDDPLERGFDNPVNGGTAELPDGTPTHMQFIMFANDPEVARAVAAAEESGNPILAAVLRAGFEALGLVKPLPGSGS